MSPHDRQHPPFDPNVEVGTHQTQPHQTQPFYSNIDGETIAQLFDRALGALKRLPKEGQILIILTAAVLGISLVVTLLKLVNFILSLALLGGFLYIGYKFLITSSVQDSEP